MHSRLFKPSAWLGFPHDGYPVVSLDQYLEVRESTVNQIDSALSAARHIQSLLTFGVLEAVVEKPVPESTLVRGIAPGVRTIGSDGLTEVIRDWIQRIREHTEDRKAWRERVHRTLRQSILILTGLMKQHFNCFDPLGDDAPPTVCLIAVIGETLLNANLVFAKYIQNMPREGFNWSVILVPAYRALLEEDMLAQGWCSSVVDYLIRTVRISSLEYAVSCGPPKDEKDHRNCSSESCATYIVDVGTYTPRHATPACQSLMGRILDTCHNVSPDLEEVERLLLAGHVPVLNINMDETKSYYKLTVHKASDTQYIAISHVWADGLGSTTEDGLPMCQIRRLSNLIGPGIAFWIDSLCIPKLEAARKKAIHMMAQTYSQAQCVLVLDGTIQMCKTTEHLGVHILRVLTSGWMRRLWTLQEAELSKELYFVFSDGRVSLKSLIQNLTGDMLMFPYLSNLARELFRLTKMTEYNKYSISDISHSLRWRSTNRPTDETLAIASLLGVQSSLLIDLSPEKRMMHLIRELHTVPSNILFVPGDKSQIPGFRWLPTSFMAAHGGSSGGAQLSISSSGGFVTPRGLEATYYVLKFSTYRPKGGEPWGLRDTKNERYYKVFDPSSSENYYDCDILLLAHGLPPMDARVCVAGLTSDFSFKADRSIVRYTKYQRRLVISREVDQSEAVQNSSFISVQLSGTLRVCVG